MQNERVISGKGVIGKIDGTDAWVTGEKVRANREDDKITKVTFLSLGRGEKINPIL